MAERSVPVSGLFPAGIAEQAGKDQQLALRRQQLTQINYEVWGGLSSEDIVADANKRVRTDRDIEPPLWPALEAAHSHLEQASSLVVGQHQISAGGTVDRSPLLATGDVSWRVPFDVPRGDSETAPVGVLEYSLYIVNSDGRPSDLWNLDRLNGLIESGRRGSIESDTIVGYPYADAPNALDVLSGLGVGFEATEGPKNVLRFSTSDLFGALKNRVTQIIASQRSDYEQRQAGGRDLTLVSGLRARATLPQGEMEQFGLDDQGRIRLPEHALVNLDEKIFHPSIDVPYDRAQGWSDDTLREESLFDAMHRDPGEDNDYRSVATKEVERTRNGRTREATSYIRDAFKRQRGVAEGLAQLRVLTAAQVDLDSVNGINLVTQPD